MPSYFENVLCVARLINQAFFYMYLKSGSI